MGCLFPFFKIEPADDQSAAVKPLAEKSAAH
jgi:hypothetical protein